MNRTLELVFRNREGKVTRITIDNPVEPVDPQAVETAMDAILTADIFNHGGGLVEKIEARIVGRSVEQISFA